MNAITQPTQQPAMRMDEMLAQDPSRIIRELTETAISPWPLRVTPKRPAIAKVRGRIKWGGIEPIRPLYVMALGAIDEGKPVEIVVQWAKDFIASVEAYASRRNVQSAGVLPFSQVHVRLVTRSIREDCEADVTTAGVDLESVDSLETARRERLDAIAADEALVDAYTARIAALRAKA